MIIRKNIPKIHYITQEVDGKSHEQLAKEACEAGANLIQLRIKDRTSKGILGTAWKTKKICDDHNAMLIINDHLEIAKEIDADGVHLGNTDMDHFSARKLLGPRKIIGGTAYTEKEAYELQSDGIVDYIGLGTYRKTRTKPEIKDFLSLEQISDLTKNLEHSRTQPIPIIVIGGVRIDDIQPLLSAGAYGIAIASLVNASEDKAKTMLQIKNEFNKFNKVYLNKN